MRPRRGRATLARWLPLWLALWLASWMGTAAQPAAAGAVAASASEAADVAGDSVTDAPSAQITVTAERVALIGTAATASEGVVEEQELQLLPAYRPAQLLETVPGLIATLHSGEGKASQYLMRGYNLDHGTDLAVFVDGMPVNQPTHAHGQGYTDLNFVVPELASGLDYTKGPYYASVGDFGSVGSVHVGYVDTVADQVAVGAGTLGFRRLFGAGSEDLAGGRLLAAVEAQHYDGPYLTPDDARKENAVVRYSEGDAHDGYSLTAMYYHQLWTNTTDIPLRAIDEGAVPDRFGTLDPTDGGRAERASLSAQYRASVGGGQLSASTFFLYNALHLYNDFTHYLVDPVHGDQEDQFENRHALGGTAVYTLPLPLEGIDNELSLGALARYDALALGRLPSQARTPLPAQDDPPPFADSDQVYLFSGAAFLQATTRWSTRLRSVLGLRIDYQHGTDIDYLAPLHQRDGYSNGGTASQALAQPKASVIFAATSSLELYASAGEGFHSADLRGVNQDKSVDLGLPHTPLLASQWGEEVGIRAQPRSDLNLTLAIYDLWQQSETILDPDVGQDSAGPPSRRYGLELNVTHEMGRGLEFYGSYSVNHSRFTRAFDDGTGHLGTYLPDAPAATGSASLYLTDLGPWSAGVEYRYLGNYPLSPGPCVDSAAVRDFPRVATSCANAPTASGQVDGKGFGELNLAAHYAPGSGWRVSLGLYNLLNTRAAAAEFWYVDRLRSETARYPEGRADIHEHPLEPFMARLTVSVALGRDPR